jgi:hypothetical protein
MPAGRMREGTRFVEFARGGVALTPPKFLQKLSGINDLAKQGVEVG